jgi:hypothetical protein
LRADTGLSLAIIYAMACGGAKKQIKFPAAQQSLVSEFWNGKILEVTVYIYIIYILFYFIL